MLVKFDISSKLWKHSLKLLAGNILTVCGLYHPGCDAAGSSAPRWSQDEERGGHGSGLCQRDHDPHALPSERDHHLHVQTGTPCVQIKPKK